MRISSKQTFLYPVLREGSEDFGPEYKFTLEIHPVITNENSQEKIGLNFLIDINVPSILDALQSGDATLYIDLRSPSSMFQHSEIVPIHKVSEKLEGTIVIPAGSLYGELSCTAVIVVSKDNFYFHPTEANVEFGQFGFDLDFASPLAISRSLAVPVSFENRSSNAFIHIVTSRELESSVYEIRTQEDQLTVMMGVDARNAFEIAKSSPTLRPYMFMSVYKDCLASALETIAKSPDENYQWMSSLTEILRQRNEYISTDSTLNDFNRIALSLVANSGVRRVATNEDN